MSKVKSPVSYSRTSRNYIQPIAAILLALLVLGVPFWVVIMTACKDRAQAAKPNLALPTSWHLWENFVYIFTETDMVSAFFGSVILLVPTVFILLLIGSMASWVLARRSSRTMSILYTVAISGIVLPPAVVTVVLLLRQLGLAGTPIGLIAVYTGMYISMVIFFVTGFIRTIPTELEEAARIDGASPLKVFFSIVFPLLLPTLSTVTILVSLYVWNDIFYALFVVGGRMNTLTLNLAQVASAGINQNNWHYISSYIILMSLPLLLIFIFAQRKIISGITGGAVK